jgi:hypothetical protein
VNFLRQITVYDFHKQKKCFKMILILTLFTACTTILYIGCYCQGNPYVGKTAGARIVTDQETEDLPSELPSRIAVLLAIRDCLHNMKAETIVMQFVSLEDRLHFL